jgi:hypothetical protein
MQTVHLHGAVCVRDVSNLNDKWKAVAALTSALPCYFTDALANSMRFQMIPDDSR